MSLCEYLFNLLLIMLTKKNNWQNFLIFEPVAKEDFLEGIFGKVFIY